MEKIHVYERDAYYYETDKMSVVHHSNYIRWFEEARVNFMKKVGYRTLWRYRINLCFNK